MNPIPQPSALWWRTLELPPWRAESHPQSSRLSQVGSEAARSSVTWCQSAGASCRVLWSQRRCRLVPVSVMKLSFRVGSCLWFLKINFYSLGKISFLSQGKCFGWKLKSMSKNGLTNHSFPSLPRETSSSKLTGMCVRGGKAATAFSPANEKCSRCKNQGLPAALPCLPLVRAESPPL